MRIIIVGNGLAGVISAKTLRDLDKDVEIDIFASERYYYYPRPNLIEFLAKNIPLERVFAFPKQWYEEQRIRVHLENSVTKVVTKTKQVETEEGQTENYDVLILATGSSPSIPPFKGADKKGVFTLRTLDDVYEIIDALESSNKVVLIGGGLLGLEIARAVKSRGAEVEVVEFFDRLLPRQLDRQGAALLQAQIENMGIKVQVGIVTEEISGQKAVEGLRFKDGGGLQADMAIVAAGIKPDIGLAQNAGLKTDRGVVVNEFLQTSEPSIYAAGDCIQFHDRIWGIIPASFDQAQVAASNILEDQPKKYRETIPSNTLKVVGLYVTSIGQINPEEGRLEEIRLEKKEEGIYKKIVCHEGRIVGAIWMGTKKGVDGLNRLISQKVDVTKWKDALLEDDFDFSVV
jgi:nitrite reductase (NADH) large subunit